ncbi:complex I NDUFA9 subunit family protein [Lichenicoccus roseus]|uniref:Complex I NDUFA9 subunit family protein n=1 Tax=Lichenicoccus roseus TaxID=2683649 RepID=A0A5R9J5Q2_9PROT|nr:complex I NDUFA9 subunit family protein [Lichenicoccus roseus]TLU72289.1 complex I NDUFA9 subunit family protein [Lichenicoccus roseus]
MATRSVATVFGGSGFLGRYVVKRLAQQGHVVRVAVRRPARANELRPMGRVGQVVPLYASLADEASIAQAVEGADIVVNLVGILAEARAGDFMRVHADGAGRVARLSAAAGAGALVQMSAIGAATDSPSLYGRSKQAGEQAVHDAFPAAVVLRPSIVFGPEDAFFNRFAGIARLAPVFPLFCGDTKFQPVYAGDVAEAVLRAVEIGAGGVFELGGPRVWSFRELMVWMLHELRRKPRIFEVPMGLARLQASILEHVPGKPLTRDQLTMLARDNVVSDGMAGFEELGIAPTPLELVVPGYLNRYRPGGGKRELPK